MKAILPKEQRIKCVLQTIYDNPGINISDIARNLSISVRSTANWLTEAKATGEIGYTSNAEKRLGWFPIGMVAQARAEALARRKKDKNAKRRHAIRKAREMKVKQEPKPAPPPPVDPGDVPMVQRWVPATAPLPFRCRAANSVWKWGAAA